MCSDISCSEFTKLWGYSVGEKREVPEVSQVTWLGERGGHIALSFYIEFCVVLLLEFWLFYMPFAPHTLWVIVGLTHSTEYCLVSQDSYHFLTGVYCWLIGLRKGSELGHTVTNIIRPGHFTAVSSAGSVSDPQWTSGGGSSVDETHIQLRSLWGTSRGVGTGHQPIMSLYYKLKWITNNSTFIRRLVAWRKLHGFLISGNSRENHAIIVIYKKLSPHTCFYTFVLIKWLKKTDSCFHVLSLCSCGKIINYIHEAA